MGAVLLDAVGRQVDEQLGDRRPVCAPPLTREVRRAHQRSLARLYQRESGQLRELHRLAGADLDDLETADAVHKLVDRGVGPIAGGAIGKGSAAFFVNLPPEGTFVFDEDYFNQETERNDVPQEVKAYTGLGGSVEGAVIAGMQAARALAGRLSVEIAGEVKSPWPRPVSVKPLLSRWEEFL